MKVNVLGVVFFIIIISGLSFKLARSGQDAIYCTCTISTRGAHAAWSSVPPGDNNVKFCIEAAKNQTRIRSECK